MPAARAVSSRQTGFRRPRPIQSSRTAARPPQRKRRTPRRSSSLRPSLARPTRVKATAEGSIDLEARHPRASNHGRRVSAQRGQGRCIPECLAARDRRLLRFEEARGERDRRLRGGKAGDLRGIAGDEEGRAAGERRSGHFALSKAAMLHAQRRLHERKSTGERGNGASTSGSPNFRGEDFPESPGERAHTSWLAQRKGAHSEAFLVTNRAPCVFLRAAKERLADVRELLGAHRRAGTTMAESKRPPTFPSRR
jgi:hypothetical protein